MPVTDTTRIAMPIEVMAGIVSDGIKRGSALAALSPAKPMLFGDIKYVTFSGEEKAELVGENDPKSPALLDTTARVVSPKTVQVTKRFSAQEFWADTQHRLGIFDAFGVRISTAIAEALDIMGIHGVNPYTGQKSTQIADIDSFDYNTGVAKVYQGGKKQDIALDAAISAIQTTGRVANGIALDVVAEDALGTIRSDLTGQLLYTDTSSYRGKTISTFPTIGGAAYGLTDAASATDIAIVGDFSKFMWGIQANPSVEVIPMGDPDGLGDLKRHNQIALRSEVAYAWSIMVPENFAVLRSGNAPS